MNEREKVESFRKKRTEAFTYFAPRFQNMEESKRSRPLSHLTQSMPHYPIIELIDKDFELPQLGKKRRIWALLPHDYYDNNRDYPVLYLQDAQNLFDEEAPFGSWSIDRHLRDL
ncbi:MAG: hypothetical protein ABIQ11_00505, partial [Saprospiraceae bacterium]